jgi:hypothetical protein
MVFIKKVLMQGFRSYKDLTDFDEFEQGLNVVGTLDFCFLVFFFFFFVCVIHTFSLLRFSVGRNGYGKSNFFLGKPSSSFPALTHSLFPSHSLRAERYLHQSAC